VKCPACGAREVGNLTPTHHFCWECYVEFTVGDGGIEVYEVEEDGTLVPLGRTVVRAVPGSTENQAVSPGR